MWWVERILLILNLNCHPDRLGESRVGLRPLRKDKSNSSEERNIKVKEKLG